MKVIRQGYNPQLEQVYHCKYCDCIFEVESEEDYDKIMPLETWGYENIKQATSMDFEDGELVTVLDINLRAGMAFCKSAKSGSDMCRTVPTDELAFINPDDYDTAGVFATEIQEPLMDVDTLRNMVIRQVNKCREEYVKNYGSPRFVKLPLWTYSALKQWSVIYNEVLEASSPERLIGLNVCPTNSIERIEDIEVF